jgi:hypothetical protein
MNIIPFSGLYAFIVGLLSLSCWLVIAYRHRQTETSSQVKNFGNFFKYFALFLIIYSLAHIVLYIDVDLFPRVMNWGYIISHFFLFVSLAWLIRISIIEFRWILHGRELLLFRLWLLIGISITLLNVIFPNQFEFDFNSGVTRVVETSVPTRILLPMLALATYLPTILIFGYHGLTKKTSKPRRVRSLFLASGFLSLAITGPLHNYVQNALTLLLVDLVTAASLVLILVGIILKPKEHLTTDVAANS